MKRTTALGFALGALAGGVTALLTAPKSGRSTRKQLKESAQQMKDTAMEKIEEGSTVVKDNTSAASNRIKDQAQSALTGVQTNAAALAEAAQEGRRVYREHLEANSTNGRLD